MSLIKSKLVMLPTKEKANIGADNWYLRNTNVLVINGFKSNLYFITDDEIKEGDWFILFFGLEKPELLQATKENLLGIKSNCKKIIATTDSKLTIDGYDSSDEEAIVRIKLPQPSPEFIAKYIKAYNEGTPITEVMVECEDCGTLDSQFRLIEHFDTFGTGFYMGLRLKISKDNTITIRKVMDVWNREELELKLQQYGDYVSNQVLSSGKPLYKSSKEWIEENL